LTVTAVIAGCDEMLGVPQWLQILIILPHGLLGFVDFWFWWQKTVDERRKFGIVAAYLLVFYLVMRFVFKCW